MKKLRLNTKLEHLSRMSGTLRSGLVQTLMLLSNSLERSRRERKLLGLIGRSRSTVDLKPHAKSMTLRETSTTVWLPET